MKKDILIAEEKKIYTFRESLDNTLKLHGDRDAFVIRDKNDSSGYRHITHREFRDEINAMGTFLVDMGLQGEKITVIGENRYEWCLAYLATTCGCGVIVPVDKELNADEVAMIINRSEAKAVVFSGKIYEKNLHKALMQNESVKILVCMDDEELDAEGRDYFKLSDVLEKGKSLVENGDRRYLDAEIDGNAMSILLFTSGTTGVAKGVMLSQRNVCADIQSVVKCLDNGCTDRVLSILPIHHTYECTCDFLVMMHIGACMTFCDGLRHIAKNIQEYSPTILMLVPLILENVHAKIMKQASANPIKKVMFKFLLALSGMLQKLGFKNVGRKFFSQVHKSMGGRLRLVIAGAAAMSPKISKDFNRMGIAVRQGYGLTETSPILCVSRDTGNIDASVGPAMPGIEVRIDNPDENGCGEIIAKGDNIMLGYYEDAEATAAVLTEDGWFHTGDLGRMDDEGRVYITGRLKSMIVTKTGKNIFPEELEAKIDKIPVVMESMVVGEDSDKDEDTIICAVIVPNNEALAEAGVASDDEKAVHDYIWDEIKKINKELLTYKRIQKIRIRKEEFEKTTTHKIKRHGANLAK